MISYFYDKNRGTRILDVIKKGTNLPFYLVLPDVCILFGLKEYIFFGVTTTPSVDEHKIKQIK